MVTSELISHFEFFSGLSPGQLGAVAGISREMSAKKGEKLFKEADNATRLYFLQEGKVSIRIQLSSSPEEVAVAIINQGFGFGWSALVEPYYYTASAECEEDSRMTAIDGQKLMQILEAEPQAGFLILKRVAAIISKRLRNSRSALLKTL